MARGKIQIKRIENSTNRQVTYSKRRNGLFKKAHELTVLCDAKVSIIMLSTTGKIHDYISPSTSTKQLFDQYQKALGIDLWSSHYEVQLKLDLSLRYMQRMGENLNDLSFKELRDLEEDMENSLKIIRDRKYRVIGNQIVTHRKKARNVEDIHRNLLHDVISMDARDEDPHFGLIDNGGDYDSFIGLQHGGTRLFA